MEPLLPVRKAGLEPMMAYSSNSLLMLSWLTQSNTLVRSQKMPPIWCCRFGQWSCQHDFTFQFYRSHNADVSDHVSLLFNNQVKFIWFKTTQPSYWNQSCIIVYTVTTCPTYSHHIPKVHKFSKNLRATSKFLGPTQVTLIKFHIEDLQIIRYHHTNLPHEQLCTPAICNMGRDLPNA